MEHRLFSFISINRCGKPLTECEVILELIANTTSITGLKVTSYLDINDYPTGIKTSNARFAAVPVTPHDFHGERNYTIACGR